MFPTTVFVFCLAGIVFGAIENPAGGEVQPSSFSHSSSFQGNFVSNNGSRHSNYQFINGNCHVSNGVVDDNGSQRPLTDNEKQQIEQYEKDMEQYGVDFAKSMQQWTQNMMRQMFDSFGASFPFGNREEQAKPAAPVQPIMPMIPRVPCFCQSCKQNTTETVLPASAGKNADE